MSTNQRLAVTVLGLGLVIVGLLIADYCFNVLGDADRMGTDESVPEVPVKPVAALICPAEWLSGDAGSVKVTIASAYPTQSMGYTVHFLITASGHNVFSKQPFTLQTTIPAGQSVSLALPSLRPPPTAAYSSLCRWPPSRTRMQAKRTRKCTARTVVFVACG